MSEIPRCPQCHESLTQVGKHWVCPEHGQISPGSSRREEAPISSATAHPLRIFLSYGHDGNEPLVRRIKADLENRGHDVWFDKSEIKFGDNWRRVITDGIIGSNRVLSFLSKHSTRDPGVCRDEIAIAIGVKGGNIQTVLVESEKEVQPPVNIGHIQWLDMHDWKERQQRGSGVPPEHPDSWETWYQARFDEIIRVVESDESRRFAGEIETLHGHLKPIKSDARIYDLLRKGFFGRAWLFEAVEKWRCDIPRVASNTPESAIRNPQSAIPSRLFWITGDPGVGKSAFAAQLTHTRSDAVIAAQFVEWDKPDHRDARRVVRSLAFQLATRLPDYRKLLLTLPEIAELDRKDPAELFDYLLANPLRSVIGGGRDRQLIIIDALDEAGEAGRNPLVEMLARHAPRLPDWLGLVVTSRPESAVQAPLQGLNPFVLDTRTEANRADLRDYLRQKLARQLHDRLDADRLLGQILEKSEGVFLYVERFCDDVQQNHLSLDRPEQFPQGLGGIFCQWFQRQFPDLEKFRKDVRPALRAILAAREPLPVEILQRLFHWQDEELRDFIRTLGSLFPVTKEANGEVIKPYHKSLADWLANGANAGAYFVSADNGHEILANDGWNQQQLGGLRDGSYYWSYLPSHLAQAERSKELLALIEDSNWGLIERWTEMGFHQQGIECLKGLLSGGVNLDSAFSGWLATQLGFIYAIRGDHRESIKWFDWALEHTSYLKGRRIRAIAFHERATVHLHQEQFHEAASSFRKALVLCEWGWPQYPDEIAANLVGLATVRLAENRFPEARKLARRARRYASRCGDMRHLIAAYRLVANVALAVGDWLEVEPTVRLALDLCQSAEIELERARLLMLLGRLRYVQNDMADAYVFFRDALGEAKKAQNLYGQLEGMMSLGWCEFVRQHMSDGAEWFKNAAALLPSEQYFELHAWNMLGKAVEQHLSKRFADAERDYTAACFFCSEHQIRFWQVKALVGIGAIQWWTERYVAAENAFGSAKKLAVKISPGAERLVDASVRLCKSDPLSIPR